MYHLLTLFSSLLLYLLSMMLQAPHLEATVQAFAEAQAEIAGNRAAILHFAPQLKALVLQSSQQVAAATPKVEACMARDLRGVDLEAAVESLSDFDQVALNQVGDLMEISPEVTKLLQSYQQQAKNSSKPHTKKHGGSSSSGSAALRAVHPPMKAPAKAPTVGVSKALQGAMQQLDELSALMRKQMLAANVLCFKLLELRKQCKLRLQEEADAAGAATAAAAE
jgi:hypothetical protein